MFLNLLITFSSIKIRKLIIGVIKCTLVELSQISPVVHETIKNRDRITLSFKDFQYLQFEKNIISTGVINVKKPKNVVTAGAFSILTKVDNNPNNLDKKL